MNEPKRFDVLVVGGGAAGSCAAAALSQRGFAVALVEPEPIAAVELDAPLYSRVVALSPASVRFLERLGAWPLAAGRAFAFRDMEVQSGDHQLSFNHELATESALGWIVELRALQSAVFDVARRTNTRFCPGRVVACRAGAGDATVELADGAVLHARLVVSAEGGKSSLREAAGLNVVTRDYRSRAIVAHLRTEHANFGTAFQRFLPGGPLALLPIDAGRSSLVWTRPEVEALALLELDDAAFCQRVSAASGGRFGRVIDTTARAAFPLRMQLAQRFYAERLALLGDAAHVVHPLAGLGLNLGLIDAAALVDVLVEARIRGRDFGAPTTLSRYDSWRRSDTHAVARLIDVIERGFAKPGAIERWCSRGLGMVDALVPAKRRIAAAACGNIGRVPSLARRPA